LSAGSGGADRHSCERLFVAWEPDAPTLAALAACATDWRACEPSPGLRWQHAAQLHLTLRFLGSTGAMQRTGIEAGLAVIAARRTPARAQSAALAAWPSARAPRVLVLALRADAALAGLAEALETLARDCGYPAETRRFRPHFTLARARDGTVLERPAPPAPRFACTVDALSLVRSTPGPSGSRYDVVARWPLGNLAAP